MRRVSLEDAARVIGRQPITIKRWIERGDLFADGEVLRGRRRGRGHAYLIDLDALYRVDAADRALEAEPLSAGDLSKLRDLRAERPPASTPAPVRPPTRPRDSAATMPVRRPSSPVQTLAPSGAVTARKVGEAHEVARSTWRRHIERGDLPAHRVAPPGGGEPVALLGEEGLRAFGRLFADRLKPCNEPGCLVCEAAGLVVPVAG